MVTQVRWQSPSHVDILGIPVDRVTMDEAMAAVESFIAIKEPHLVVTADASGIVIAQDDPEFKELLLEADLVTPDSSGILWASARLGQPIADRVSGVDMVDRICALSADKGYRLFFLGAAPGVAETAAEKLRLKHPGCNIVGTRHGYFPSDSDEVVAKEVADFKPDVLFVAMGIPRQEKFIRATQDIVQAPVAMGVGGSFDVFSGRAKRAPKFVQRMRMEWLWRLILNPKKFAKAKTLPRFMMMVLRSGR
jgi:N-acetylglucosaminyldiphosphoundecaprenol N-acetyl-beta-D-mannosaminyltransferase